MASAKLKINVNDVIDSADESSAKKRAWKKVFKENPSAVVEYGLRVVDEIISRTSTGIDINGKSFKPYSKSYKKSDNFKIYGKDSTVDLKLTGSMLADLSVTKTSSTSVLLHFPTGEENDKAARHNYGLKGMPKREFMGISDEDSTKILKGVVKDYNAGIGDLLTSEQKLSVSTNDVSGNVSSADLDEEEGEL